MKKIKNLIDTVRKYITDTFVVLTVSQRYYALGIYVGIAFVITLASPFHDIKKGSLILSLSLISVALIIDAAKIYKKIWESLLAGR